ncbi:SLATT domain-containing protein [Microbulbifer sp. ZKSA002]|uniref:SLATT domain-containing protein n=1 Tax=Microbulbifer sp. ZKSA002 TaxID=3243388 RepID=UPI00403A3395
MAFSDNMWWTRKAKIQAENRLLSNAFQSRVLLLWYSFSSVASAVYYLKSANGASETSEIAWVVFSVLVLCMSGFINGLSFEKRAGLIKECYEKINSLYKKSKNQNSDISKLNDEYDQLLGVCENHLSRDYYRALCIEHISTKGKADKESGLKEGLDRCPTWFHWSVVGCWFTLRLILLSLLYALPVFIFLLLFVSDNKCS